MPAAALVAPGWIESWSQSHGLGAASSTYAPTRAAIVLVNEVAHHSDGGCSIDVAILIVLSIRERLSFGFRSTRLG
jgi:hypothetical protein